MPDQIFISYRRDDAAYVTGHINDLLRKEFGDEAVFTDVDNIALGVDFRAVLDETVSQCQVLLAVIGSGWLSATGKDGQLRLQDPADFVRIEIESALKRNIPVIPLLVSGAKMPAVEDLPESLRGLAFRNGTQIRPAPDFRVDMERLIKNLRRHFDAVHGDEPGIPLAADSSPAEEAASEPSADVESTGDQASTEDESPSVRIAVADDERARKRAELGMEKAEKPKRSGAVLWLVAVVALAGGGWFYASQNPGTVESLLGAVQSAGSGAEPGAAPGDEMAADSSISGNNAVAEESPAAAAVAVEVAEPGIAIDTGGGIEVETAAGDAVSIAVEAADDAVDAAAAVAESSTEATGDAAESASSAVTEPAAEVVADAASAEAVDAPPPVPVDDEVRLTPGSQRLSDSSAYISEGVRLAAIGDHEGAIENFDAAITLDVQPAFAFKQRAASYQSLGQHEAAIRDYDEAIARNSDDVNAYYNRGATHIAVGDYVAAIADFDTVIQFDPEFVDAYSKRADAHEAVGNSEAAVRDRAVVEVFESNRGNPR